MFSFHLFLICLYFSNYSMGAVMCFEAARHLKTKHGIEPMHLLISSASAPQVIKQIYVLMSSTEIKTEILIIFSSCY